MIEKIEAKIEAYINSVLAKDTLELTDYQALTWELSRLTTKAREAKMESESKAHQEKLIETLTAMVASN